MKVYIPELEHVHVTHSEHRLYAGIEGSSCIHSPVDIDTFFTEVFHGGLKFSSIRNPKLSRIRRNLAKVKPKVLNGNLSEKPMYDPLVKACNSITEEYPGKALPISFHEWADRRHQESNDPNRRLRTIPDISIIHRGHRLRKNVEYGDQYWGRGVGFIEVKAREDQDPFYQYDGAKKLNEEQHSNWCQLQEYAVIAFLTIPHSYLLGIGVFDDKARLYRWDRSSVLMSAPIDCKTDPIPLAYFIGGMALYENSGMDDTIDRSVFSSAEVKLIEEEYARAVSSGILQKYTSCRPGETLIDESSRLVVPDKSRGWHTYLTLGRPVFCSPSHIGRGTRVWLAKRTGRSAEGEDLVIIKDSWQPRNRKTEGGIYKAIGENIFGIARFLYDFDVCRPNADEEPHSTAGARLNKSRERHYLTDRVHHRCILSSVGIPLSHFTYTRQLLEVLRDVVKGLQKMSGKKILHRDISTNNIMISASPEKEHGAKGFLIDPEFAVTPDMVDLEKELKMLTGTMAFISIDRLEKPAGGHQPWHDLESVFWVLLHTVFRHVRCYVVESGQNKPGWEFLAPLFDTSDPSSRSDFLVRKTRNLHVVDNEPLTMCLHRLGKLVWSQYFGQYLNAPHPFPEELNQLTHENVIAAFEEAIDSGGWPQDNDASTPFELIQKQSQQGKGVIDAQLQQGFLAVHGYPSPSPPPSQVQQLEEDLSRAAEQNELAELMPPPESVPVPGPLRSKRKQPTDSVLLPDAPSSSKRSRRDSIVTRSTTAKKTSERCSGRSKARNSADDSVTGTHRRSGAPGSKTRSTTRLTRSMTRASRP
ncbi:hypothetical protein NEOLEDRAFT_1173647 [Neolentinus lepideus HHB14362 ss-1]|uniref:Fungal-type protein kinase domain-containing protein n=1 Tax=Neolentinus lepideus HHB14362 ss-1 TaxID=1314782 RepID=A0A165MF99_9AGAM|nr:hypothetical protein NEOLEDRAFT_1173647 [Neolentinus lepideus HHB14362 ss-1]